MNVGPDTTPSATSKQTAPRSRILEVWDSILGWFKAEGRFLTRLTFALLGLVFLAMFLKGTLFAPTNIGSPSTESDALVRANERLLEMAKWTISTILLIGGGLIGLNWYSNEHRYQSDKSQFDKEVRNHKEALERRIVQLEATHSVYTQNLVDIKVDVFKLTNQITQTMLFQDEINIAGGYVASVIRLLDRPDASEMVRQNALDGVIDMFERPDAASSFSAYLGAKRLPELAEAARKLGHRAEAESIEQLYQTYVDSRQKES